MKRCPNSGPAARALAALLLVAGASSLLAPTPAWAQTGPGATAANPLDQRTRQFPPDARRGILQVAAANVIRMDGQPDRLAPGARIRDAQNRIVLTGALVGQTLRVNYTRENAGQVHEVWILSAEEAAQKRAGNNDLVQRNFRFASED
jgi:hypothetical protein